MCLGTNTSAMILDLPYETPCLQRSQSSLDLEALLGILVLESAHDWDTPIPAVVVNSGPTCTLRLSRVGNE